jgi:hypothetical protein
MKLCLWSLDRDFKLLPGFKAWCWYIGVTVWCPHNSASISRAIVQSAPNIMTPLSDVLLTHLTLLPYYANLTNCMKLSHTLSCWHKLGSSPSITEHEAFFPYSQELPLFCIRNYMNPVDLSKINIIITWWSAYRRISEWWPDLQDNLIQRVTTLYNSLLHTHIIVHSQVFTDVAW